MSIFMVDPEHINVLVWAATRAKRSGMPFYTLTGDAPTAYNAVTETGKPGTYMRELREGSETEFGQMLVDANAASVNARYGENSVYVYAYQPPRRTDWRPVDILRAISCFEYQACEVENWPSSEAKLFCERLAKVVVAGLPGYSKAPWEITPKDVPAHVASGVASR